MAVTDNGKAVRRRRAGLIRLVRAAADALRAAGSAPARVCALVDPSAKTPAAAWRALPGGGRALELTVPAALLEPEALLGDVPAALAAATQGRPYPAAAAVPAAKVLLFRSLLEEPGKEGADRLNQGTLYLASALRAAGVSVVLSDVKASRFRRDPAARAKLEALLALHPDIGLAGLSLYDAYFEDARELAGFLRERLRARVAVGALMPTRDPQAALAHFVEADAVVRGAGEEMLPRLAALAGAAPSGRFDDAARGALLELEGTLAADDACAVWAGAERVNRVADLDRSVLDFSFVETRDAESGATFCLSRGCEYACFFCTSPDQGLFAGKSPEAVGRVLAAYGRRLRELYGSWSAAPADAFALGFYDDDFLADPARARAVLAVVKASPFHLRFVQTAIRSLVPPGNADILEPSLFEPKGRPGGTSTHPQVYLGTESFCDAELTRLGKGYGVAEVESVARTLSAKGLRQAHHFIASNVRTRPTDVLESLTRIVALRAECGDAFSVLQPAISHLKSFPGTPSWRSLAREGLLAQVRRRGLLSVEGFPEFDYPLVDRDEPADPDVAAWAESLAGKGAGVDWESELESVLFEWLLRSERLAARGVERERAARLRRAVDAHAGLAAAGGSA